MRANRFYFFAAVVLLIVLGYLTYQILRPFLSPIAWAIILSIVFYPVYAFIFRYLKFRSVASLLTIIVILLVILGPLSYISYVLTTEITHLIERVQAGEFENLKSITQYPAIKSMVNSVLNAFNVSDIDLNKTVSEGVTRLGKGVLSRVSKSVGDIISLGLNFIFMLFSIFFLLRDGPALLKKGRDYMPFSDEQKHRLGMQIRDIVISTLYGGVVVALVQGVIGGISYYFLGVPAPVLWGLATAVASFIPLIGSTAVWGPVAVYLFFKGAILKGVIMVLVGTFVIALIDNVLRPIFIGGRTRMPILVIFFSILGGIKLFGLIGFIVGPLVLALFFSIITIFRDLEESRDSTT